MRWIFTALLTWLLCGPVLAQHRYWDADYDSLARVLPRQRADTARLRTIVHLLDLHPTNEQAEPLLDELLVLNQRLHQFNDQPYRHLRAGLRLWHRPAADADAAALDSVKAAVAAFDQQSRPIPLLLMDLVQIYNRLGHMDARRRYYDHKLTYYRVRGATENITACYLSQGHYYRRMGDYNSTINCILRAADLALTFSKKLHANELIVTGAIYADWDNPRRALQYMARAQALPEFQRLPGSSRVFTFLALSKLYADKQQYALALQAADSCLAVHNGEGYDHRADQAYGLLQKGAVLLRMKQPDAAVLFLRRAQQLDDSLALPISDKPGEFEIDAAWAEYYTARHDDARAETYWLRAYHKAKAAKLIRLQPKYLQRLANFYAGHGRTAEALGFTRAYVALTDSLAASRSIYNVAQYESERVEQAQNAQIIDLRQARAVQEVQLRLNQRLLLGALLAVLAVSGLGIFIFRQLQVNRRNLEQLRQTQVQLVQAEKMAFLGELTAGIAHELQNPLNFMKNFAEVSTELVEDMKNDGDGRAKGLEGEILAGLKQNLQKISQHGQRASSIIKDMLEHSRSGTAPRQPTDLNALAADALALADQGLRTTDKEFEAELARELDPQLGTVAVVPQDLSRVLLNLCTNALHAVRQRQQAQAPGYVPRVSVGTRRLPNGQVEIRVRDNGVGMDEAVKARIFQPFFTTKPAGEGTGLGLSLSHDIVTKGHGGTIAVETQPGVGTEFVVTLPV